MLVMNGQRFGRLTRDVGRTSGHLEQLTPVFGRLGISPGAARENRERPERSQADRVARARSSPPGRECERPLEGLACAPIESGAPVDRSEAERLLSVTGGAGASLHEFENLRRQRGEREQIAPVVLQHCPQRTRVACP
jgi:hypothetical protein